MWNVYILFWTRQQKKIIMFKIITLIKLVPTFSSSMDLLEIQKREELRTNTIHVYATWSLAFILSFQISSYHFLSEENIGW